MDKIATIADIDNLKQDYRDLISISKSQANKKIQNIEYRVLEKLDIIDNKMDKYLDTIINLYEDVSRVKDKVEKCESKLFELEV